VDVVLVGLPGSGKSVVGRRLAQRHAAQFIDVDERIESAAGRSIPEIFDEEGEPAFRAMERRAIADLGPADRATDIRRVIATGGGAVVDPRNRWALYRGRTTVWLDGRPEVLAQRLRRSPRVRPLVAGRDPIGAIRDLAARRERFYAAAEIHQFGVIEVHGVVDALEARIAEVAPKAAVASADGHQPNTTLLRTATPIGRIVLGSGIAADALNAELDALGARRAILVSEPGAWRAFGERLASDLETRGREIVHVLLPEGESAKRLSVVDAAASELAELRVQRDEAIIAVGGGALGDTAGFLAAVYLRGIRFIQVPTTLVAQIDSSIGGKTGVDLPEGKNLVGAFHQPTAVVIDVEALRTLPGRQSRAALGEAVKMATLGDERLFDVLEADGPAIARGDSAVFDRGVVAEVVERAAWAKVAIVSADERERHATGGRITLNLGHSLGHAVEAAAGYGGLLHGEAVAYGLRAACRIGVELGVTPPERGQRIGRLLDALDLATTPLSYRVATVLDHLGSDKKHAAGRLRWILPTADGVIVRDDVDPAIVERAAASMLAAPSASLAPSAPSEVGP
jgi:shikimate kinase/3-dehydroquinate synthase